jgi:hypothetical protein
MHVDEDLAEPAVRVLAGPEIDLVAADAGLLGVAISSSGKRFAPDETREARDGGFGGGKASVSRGCSIASLVVSSSGRGRVKTPRNFATGRAERKSP